MSGEPIVTIVGNLTDDPSLRFVPSGRAVCGYTVASTPRKFDKQANEWKEGQTLFMRCSCWGDMAESVAESLTRGMRVIVSGRLVQRSFTDKEGAEKTVVELDVDEVGPSLRYATAKVSKTSRSGGGGSGFGGDSGGSQQGQGSTGDPWAAAAPAASTDSPPF